MRQNGKLHPSPAHALNHKTRITAPFRAQSVSDICGGQPHLGLFGQKLTRLFII